MSDDWKYGPQSKLRVKSAQPVRYEENEPFLRPMASDQLFRPDTSAPAGMPAYGQRLTHRQAAASMRPTQKEPRQAACDAYGYGYAPSGYASAPQPAMPCYPQPGYMPYPPPMGGYYAGAPAGGAWPYPDPYAYGQPPYGVYPPYAGQPPMAMPGCPPPYAPAYMPYAQAPMPQGVPTYPTPAAPPSMQTPLPSQAVQPQPEAGISPQQRQPMPPPPVEAVPKQAVLQTFPPASIPEPARPPREEAYPRQVEQAPAEAQPFYPTPALRNYAKDFEPESQQALGTPPVAEPMNSPVETPLYPPVAELLSPQPEPEAAPQDPVPEAWARAPEPEERMEPPAPPKDVSGVVRLEPFAIPHPLAQPTLPHTPPVHAEQARELAPTPPPMQEGHAIPPAAQAVPVAQEIFAAQAVPVQPEEAVVPAADAPQASAMNTAPPYQSAPAPHEATVYATPRASLAGQGATVEDWDDDLDDGDVAGVFRQAPEPIPVPAVPVQEEEEKGHSGFVTFLLALTLLISLGVVYFTGVADSVLAMVGIPAWTELTIEADENSGAPRVFSDLPTDAGEDAPQEGDAGGGAVVSTPELAPASASGAPRLLSMSVEPSVSKAPATLVFTLESNSTVANVQLRNDSLELLTPSEVSDSPSGDGIIWKYVVEFEQAYQGPVAAYVSDGSGSWDKSGFSCQVNVQ